jgi:hypothetical protein
MMHPTPLSKTSVQRSPVGARSAWSASVGLGLGLMARARSCVQTLVTAGHLLEDCGVFIIWDRLDVRRGAQLLDVGIPKELAVLLPGASCITPSTHMLDKEVDISPSVRRRAGNLRLGSRSSACSRSRLQDS